MRKITRVSVVLAIAVGVVVGYLAGYAQFTRQISELQTELDELNDEIADMKAARLGRVAVVYYGWLVDASGNPNNIALRIAAKSPSILIAAADTEEPEYVNLSPQVLSLFRNLGTLVLAYTAAGEVPLEDVKDNITRCMSLGVDGIFVDRVPNFLDANQSTVDYYSEIYRFIKSYGSQKLVVANTGVWNMGEAVMSVTDILCVEHEWVDFATKNLWRCKYPGTRFLGLSEDVTNPDDAVALTRQAWELGILYHYSTSEYIDLESWWEEYADRMGY